MFLHNKISIYKRALFCAILALQFSVKAAPFTIKAGLFDQSKTEDLGLSTPTGTETFMIYKPTATSDHYSNAVVMTAFKGFLYCQWQSSATSTATNEMEPSWFRRSDGAAVTIFRDQSASYYKFASVSTDNGKTWTSP